MALDRILGRVGAHHQLQAPGLPAGLERARTAFVIREYARLRNTPRMSPAAARPSARYRSAIVVFVLAFVLLGFFALGRLPIDLPPSRDAPRLNIRLSMPGLTAPVIEQKLTLPLEAVLAGVPGAVAMESVTTSGSASIDRRNPAGGRRVFVPRRDGLRPPGPPPTAPPAVPLPVGGSRDAGQEV